MEVTEGRIMDMKLSVSLDPADIEFLDAEAARGRFASRSAGGAAGVRLLRQRAREDSDVEAFAAWAGGDSAQQWDSAAGDGLA
jgi:Arc/MetJ-type ribon-helix-helix transcriptional regulator